MIPYHVFVLQRLHTLNLKSAALLEVFFQTGLHRLSSLRKCLNPLQPFSTSNTTPFCFDMPIDARYEILGPTSLQKGVCEMCYGLLSREYIFVQSNFNKSTDGLLPIVML